MDRKIVQLATAKPSTAAAIAKPLSKPATPALGYGRDAADTGAAEGAAGRDGAGTLVATGAAEATGAAAVGAATDTEGAATPADGGVGKRTVGAAVGFGGKLIRTVSFLGCTLAASLGFWGTAPAGGLGVFSDINFLRAQARVEDWQCQTLIRGAEKPAGGSRQTGLVAWKNST